MELQLIRYLQTDTSTIGRIHFDRLECIILERGGDAGKNGGHPRIPAGRYKLRLREFGGFYERYTKDYGQPHPMIEIADVPGRTDVLQHKGNKVADSLGCQLYGMNWALVGKEYQVTESKKAYDMFHDKLVEAIKRGEVWLNIREEFA